jgi:stearoyl-CoA 9-desaturase NADPH oxidoreductase
VAERGAVPQVPPLQRRALRLVRSFTSPLLPDDYLELVNPLWSTRELRGRVVRIERETHEAVSVLIKPGWEWPGHLPGQYVRLGVAVDGIHHWRAYSLTSAPRRPDGCIAITPKLVPGGRVSPFLFSRLRPGAIVRLGGVEGTFVLPRPLPQRLLFISAGSGITPIISMLRSLARSGSLRDVVHVHCARSADGVIFARQLAQLHASHAGYRLRLRLTGERGRLAGEHGGLTGELGRLTGERGRLTGERLDEECADWRERHTFLCGPAGLLETIGARFRRDGDPARLHVERFQPHEGVGEGERGSGGTIDFRRSSVRGVSDGEQPILVAGERAGAKLPFGCRMGICHSCVGRLRCGQVRDLRTGRVHGQPGEIVRTCVNAPEGPVEIEL